MSREEWIAHIEALIDKWYQEYASADETYEEIRKFVEKERRKK